MAGISFPHRMNYSLALPIQDASQAGEARRLVAAWSQGRGWGQEMAGRVAIVVTELGRNLALHTQGGTLLVRSLSQGSAKGVEILSLDSGPGVANFHECLRDGHSTAGTAGTGLGAVKRASQVFATHSQPGIRTALLSEVWADPSDFSAGGHWRCGAVSVTMPGELVCGDSWAEQYGPPDVIRLMMADGLGHGEFAAEASARAMEIFERSPRIELTALLKQMHDGMRSTRGAAISIAEIDLARELVAYVGVGNIFSRIVTHNSATGLTSMNGIVGVQCRAYRLYTYPWPRGGALIMTSDGLKSHWQLGKYPGLLERPPGLIAGVLYRDYSRGSDDTTVLVVSANS
jgi:anti-sigma regulatory factor (Ser/Thr protein kinase)